MPADSCSLRLKTEREKTRKTWKVIETITALALLGLAGAAIAEEASGTLDSDDPGNPTIVLDDGSAQGANR